MGRLSIEKLYFVLAIYGLIIARMYERAPLPYLAIAFMFACMWTYGLHWLSKKNKLLHYLAIFLVLAPYISVLCDKLHLFFGSYYIQKLLNLLRLQGVFGKPAPTILSTNLMS